MYKLMVKVMVAILIGTVLTAWCPAPKETEVNTMLLSSYLGKMGEKLDCHFTFEDRPNPEGYFPWIANITDFTPDPEITTIDALVAKLDNELDGVKVARSMKHPSVVHLIAESLQEQGYVMDEQVTLEFSGYIEMLPDHLATLLDGRVKSRTWGGFREAYQWDFMTEVEIDAENETVRDVLTGAVPLKGYMRFLWESRQVDMDGTSTMVVRHYGRIPTLEDKIVTLEDYLLEMGDRLNCYFTIEDRPHPDSAEGLWIFDNPEFIINLEIETIDALVVYLGEELEGAKVVRSATYPSVVHIIAEELLQEGYVMDEKVTMVFEGELDFLPDAVGELFNGELAGSAAGTGAVSPRTIGYIHPPEVEVAAQDEIVRNVFTGAVPLENHMGLLWASVGTEIDGSPKVIVGYYGQKDK